MAAEQPPKRKRSLLIVCAAVLLIISALLLYTRLRTKPEPEMVAPPATEESAPAPAAPSGGSAAPSEQDTSPDTTVPNPEAPAEPRSGAFEVRPAPEADPAADAVGEAEQSGNVSEVAKSSYQPASADVTQPPVQPASLAPTAAPQLPPGVVFAIEEPSAAGQQSMTGTPSPIPQSLPLPPPDLGPLPLRQAAAEGDPRAQHAIALRYAQGQGTPQNLTEAARWLERAASAGLAPAQYRLGAMYERGQGVTKDLGRARSWYQAAAEKGNVKAMHNLAVLYAEGAGGAPDLEKASALFRKAAERGVRDSQFNLAILHARGLGVPQDLVEAYKWFGIAASSGDEESAKRRDIIGQALSPEDKQKAEEAIATFHPVPLASEANEVLLPEGGWLDSENSTSVDLRDESELVALVQKLLAENGYDPGPADGLLGTKTVDAITAFQGKAGLPKTGKIDTGLVAALQSPSGGNQAQGRVE